MTLTLRYVYYKTDDVWLQLKTTDEFTVCIIGGGVSGICMGKKLTEAGIRYVHFIRNSLDQCFL